MASESVINVDSTLAGCASSEGDHERVCGRVQERLHRGPFQTGLRHRAQRQRELAAPGETRGEVQVLQASLPSPVERESPRL